MWCCALQEDVAQAISAAVAAFIPAHKEFGLALLRQMTHSHPSNPGQNDQASKLQRYAYTSFLPANKTLLGPS